MIRWLAAALLLMLPGCAAPIYTEDPDAITLTLGLGGMMDVKRDAYNDLEGKKKSFIIDGPMLSADAFFAFSKPDACYTKRAVWGPHSVSFLGLAPDYSATKRAAAMLPQPLGDWYRSSWWYWDWVTVPLIGYDKLIEIWPEGACEA